MYSKVILYEVWKYIDHKIFPKPRATKKKQKNNMAEKMIFSFPARNELVFFRNIFYFYENYLFFSEIGNNLILGGNARP